MRSAELILVNAADLSNGFARESVSSGYFLGFFGSFECAGGIAPGVGRELPGLEAVDGAQGCGGLAAGDGRSPAGGD